MSHIVNACALLIDGPLDGEILEIKYPREGRAPDEWWWPVEIGTNLKPTGRIVWYYRGEQDEEDESLWLYHYDREERR